MKNIIVLLGLIIPIFNLSGQDAEDTPVYWGPFEEVVIPVNEYRSFIWSIRNWEDIRTIPGIDSLGPTVAKYYILDGAIKYIDYYHVGKRQHFQEAFYLKDDQLVAASHHSHSYSEDIPWQRLPDIWDYPDYGISRDKVEESYFEVTYYSDGTAVHQLASGDCGGILMDEYLEEVQKSEVAQLKKLLRLFKAY